MEKLLCILTIMLPTLVALVMITPLAEANFIGGGGGEVGGISIGGGGIIIGGDDPTSSPTPNCPPPPPPPCPPAPSPRPVPKPSPKPSPKGLSPRVVAAAKVIREFGKRITCDPYEIKKTWKGDNACNFKGFKCTPLDPRVEQVLYAVTFNGYGFAGDNLGIDGLLDKLPDVSLFHANSNNFTGVIPKGLDKLPYLYELDLSNNIYRGEFPCDIFKANQLKFLDLRFNQFQGRVPPQIFTLQVIALFINNNNFQMELPENLGSTPAAFITLANNKFTGSIPKSIGTGVTADLLNEVLFLDNELSGCLPYEIGLLKNARVFDVEGNKLTGPIPHSFACLSNMNYLIMARNMLYGPIPEAVCKLPNLVNLTMSNNYFTQVGPECMKLIRKGYLDVKGNCILGLPNQKSPHECDTFFNQPKYCAEEAQLYEHIPCKGKVAYLDSNASFEGRHPQPTLTYGALSPKSN